MTIDPNDPGTLDLDLDLGPTVTVKGWGTGTVAELAHFIAQLKDERDAAQANERKLERQLADAETADGRDLVAVIVRIAERVAEATVEAYLDGPGTDAIERVAKDAVEEAVELLRDDVRHALNDAAASI